MGMAGFEFCRSGWMDGKHGIHGGQLYGCEQQSRSRFRYSDGTTSSACCYLGELHRRLCARAPVPLTYSPNGTFTASFQVFNLIKAPHYIVPDTSTLTLNFLLPLAPIFTMLHLAHTSYGRGIFYLELINTYTLVAHVGNLLASGVVVVMLFNMRVAELEDKVVSRKNIPMEKGFFASWKSDRGGGTGIDETTRLLGTPNAGQDASKRSAISYGTDTAILRKPPGQRDEEYWNKLNYQGPSPEYQATIW